jgi:hypothetical protein
VFDATSGTLLASDTITKSTPAAGGLTLSGAVVDLDGAVAVSTGLLTITDQAYIADNITGAGVTFDAPVTADGGALQLFDATSGVLWAKNTITKIGSGDLTLAGETAINLDGTVDVQSPTTTAGVGGNLFILHDFSAAGDLLATNNVVLAGSVVNATLDGDHDQWIDARNGTLTASGTISKTGAGDLTLHGGSGGLAVDLADTVSVSSGNLQVVADNGDVQVGGSLTAHSGGVSIVAENGSIYTNGASGSLNVAITGSSNDNIDGSGSTGVSLPYGGKAAVVVISEDDLSFGPGAGLTAGGVYNRNRVDDRMSIYFEDAGQYGGEAIDVAVYGASLEGNVHIAAQQVYVAPGGTMVADAYDTVTFGGQFVDSLAGGTVGWLEVCSRITESLSQAEDQASLPYAGNQGAFEYLLGGSYVLRGSSFVEALVLFGEKTPERLLIDEEALATLAPLSLQLVDVGQVQGAHFEDLQWLAEELGLCEGDTQGEDESRCQEITQAYLAGAFLQSTDLRPHRAAGQLRVLAGLLQDPDGSRIAALGRVVGEFVQAPVPPSSEQMASIASALAQHSNDGTHYAAAGQWLDALGEYVGLLNKEIGWPTGECVAFVMGKYCAPITEAGEVRTIAFIQMHLEAVAGGQEGSSS